MDWTLEAVIIPVTDLDRAKAFYAEQLGFTVDHDTRMGDTVRIIQLTPPGSGCSIVIGSGMSSPDKDKQEPRPGTYHGMQLCVLDITAARAEVVARGVEAGPVSHIEGSDWAEGPGGPWNSFFSFPDPDGNTWTVQETPTPLTQRTP